MIQSKMIEEARQTNRGNKLWLEFIKAFVMLVVVTLLVQILSSLVILLLGVAHNETLVNVLFLWGQIFGIGIVLLYCRFVEKRPVSSVGFKKLHFVKHYLKGLGTGFALFASVIIVGTLLGAFRFVGISKTIDPLMLFLFFGGFLIQGMFEEVLCRGFFMVTMARKNSIVAAIIANSIIFTGMHMLNTGFGILPAINLMLFSVYASLYMLKTDNIWGVGAIHSIWNFVQGCFYGLSVSGETLSNTVLVFEATDQVWANGGAFGPEGGMVVTIVLSIEIVSLVIPYFQKKSK